jgi:hypothetical protein
VKARRLPYINAREEKAFWARVNKSGPIPEHRPDLGPCWLWMLKRGEPDSGYGTFLLKGRRYPAHRISFALARGLLRSGLDPDHLCMNPPCVNPDHLEPVRHSENVLRGLRFRSAEAEKYWHQKWHPLTGKFSLPQSGAGQ